MSTLPSHDTRGPAAISIRGLSRSFGPVKALADVSFEVPAREVTALLGENGAGKSTLLKILAGLQAPSDGSVTVFGEEVTTFAPDTLLSRHGVAIVPQELSLLPDRTVAENVLAGVEPGSRLFPSGRRMIARTQELLDELDLRIDPRASVRSLDLATQQMIVVARSIARDCRVLILDEPTSVLTPAESSRLFALMARLKEAGTTMLYVSHRMPEVFALSDQIEVLRDGRHVASGRTSEMRPDEAVAAMVGRELEQLVGRTEQTEVVEDTRVAALSFRALSGARHQDIDLEVRPGEIVGIAGLPDSGRVELLANAFGGAPGTGGTVAVGGTVYDRRSPLESVRRGLAFVPGERRAQGLLTSMNVGENISVLLNGRLTRGGLLRKKQARVEADGHAAKFRVKTASLDTPIVNLSGGNQQKAILARWLAIDPTALILDEPTRGVDVGAKAEIYEQLFALSRKGVGILCSSSDLPELLTITDRIAVMSQGRLVAVIPTSEASEEHIMTLATGAVPAV